MSGDRRRRIDKVLQVRARELDEQVSTLAAARAAEAEAARAADEAAQEVEAASQRRRQLAADAVDARRWAEEDAWLRDRESWKELSLHDLRRAAAVTQDARERVTGARVRVRQAEALVQRVAAAERAEQTRVERRAEDEVAARLADRRSPESR